MRAAFRGVFSLSLAVAMGAGAGCEPLPISDIVELTAEPAPDRIVFQMRSKEKTFADCVAGADGCAYVHFDFPAISEAPEGAATGAVTGAVLEFLLAPVLGRPTRPSNISELAESFFAAYAEAVSAQPLVPEWTLERKAFVHQSSPSIVSLGFLERSYTGGAHGNETLRFLNLDPMSGTVLALDDLIADEAREKLVGIAEERFREVRDLDDGADLEEAGFSFEGGSFALTDNFGVGEDGLTFYYNAYEIAPYVLGPTEIVVSREELEGLWRPEPRPAGAEKESLPPPGPPEPPSSP